MITEYRRRVTTEYKSDSSGVETGHKRMRDEVNKTAEAEKKAAAAREKQGSSWIDKLGKLNQAWDGLQKGIHAADAGLDAYSKTSGIAAEQAKKIRDTFEDAFDKVKVGIGAAIVGLEPFISGLGRAVSFLHDIGALGPLAIGALGAAITGNPAIGAFMAFTAAGGFDSVTPDALGKKRTQRLDGINQAIAAATSVGISVRQTGPKAAADPWDNGRSQGKIIFDKLNAFEERLLGKKSGSTPSREKGNWGNAYDESDVDAISGGGVPGGGSPGGLFPNKFPALPKYEVPTKDLETILATKKWFNELAAQRSKRGSMLEDIVGPIGQFDIYASAFSGFKDTVVAGYTAVITGTEPLGKALKHAAAQGILATGASMLVEGLKYEAMAIGEFFSYHYDAAAGHQIAAAKYFAGSAAAGIIASQLGVGGGPSAGARGGGGVGGAGGGAGAATYGTGTGPISAGYGNGTTVTNIITTTNPFQNGDTPRMQRNRARQLAELGKGGPGVGL